MRNFVNDDNSPLNQYTLIPLNMRSPFATKDLKNATLQNPFSFTKGCPVLKIPVNKMFDKRQEGHKLYDIDNDPDQNNPIDDPEIEERMIKLMIELMKKNDAPLEQYERLGLNF